MTFCSSALFKCYLEIQPAICHWISFASVFCRNHFQFVMAYILPHQIWNVVRLSVSVFTLTSTFFRADFLLGTQATEPGRSKRKHSLTQMGQAAASICAAACSSFSQAWEYSEKRDTICCGSARKNNLHESTCHTPNDWCLGYTTFKNGQRRECAELFWAITVDLSADPWTGTKNRDVSIQPEVRQKAKKKPSGSERVWVFVVAGRGNTNPLWASNSTKNLALANWD